MSAEEKLAPTTGDQQMLWLLARTSDDGSAAFNIMTVLDLRGELHASALRRALARVVARHQSWRTTFDDDGRTQRIRASVDTDIPILDLSSQAAPLRAQVFASELERESTAAFDLAGLWHRARLLRLAADHHVFLLTVHHIVSDGPSVATVLRELELFYAAETGGAPHDPPPAMQFADFVRVKAERAASPAMEEQRAYWRDVLERLTPLELPLDRPRPALRTFRGGRHSAELDTDTYVALLRFSRERRCSPFHTLLAAFSALLARWAWQDSVTIGVPYSGRDVPGSEAMVGFCPNLYPLLIPVSRATSFREHLLAVRNVVLDAHEHQGFPVATLLEQSTTDRSRAPLFGTTMTWERVRPPRFCGLEARFLQPPVHLVSRELVPDMLEIDGRLVINWDYNRDLLDHDTIVRLAEQFERICRHVLLDDGVAIGALPLVSGDERTRVLEAFAPTPGPAPDSSITAEFARQVARTPGALAVAWSGGQLTYADLDARANHLARRLRAAGVGPESPVALVADRSAEAIIGLLAILKTGAALAPISPDSPSRRIRSLIELVGARVVLTAGDLDDLPPEVRIVRLDATSHHAGAETSGLGVVVPSSGLAYTMFTSGTTSAPRAVMVSHASVLNLAAALTGAIEPCRPGPLRFAMNGALSFDTSVKQWIQLLRGHAVIPVPSEIRADPPAMLRFLTDHEIDVVDLTPSQLRGLIDAGLLGGSSAHPAVVLCGGEPIDKPLWDKLAACTHRRFYNLYGPTECTVDATACRIDPRPTPVIGRPLANVTAYPLDREGAPVPVGARGELYIGGAGVARGYHGDPVATDDRFVADPFAPGPGARMFRTGDLVRPLADGTLEYLGRIDGQLKIRGHRVEPGEIEAVLREHPDVSDAAVALVAGEGDAQVLAAYWTASAGDPAATSALQDFVAGRLPAHMVPTAFVRLDRIPLTKNGKLDVRSLPAAQAPERARDLVPRTDTEVALAAIFAELAGVPSVGLRDDFFMIGGTSMMLPRVAHLIRARLDVEIPIRSLFRYSTVQMLTAHLDKLKRAG